MMKDLRTNYKPIDHFTMENIADYMDDEIREQLNFELAPCTCEQFIAEYACRIGRERRQDFADFLADDMNLDLNDIIYTTYRDRYDHKLISYECLIWLETACPYVIKVEELDETWKRNDARTYVISMISGDFIVSYERRRNNNAR